MKTFLKWLVLTPVLLLGLVFAVVNRQLVTVVFDPFNNDIPGLSITVPLFLALALAMMLGVVIGGMSVWFSQARYRRAARLARQELDNLRASGERLRLVQPAVDGSRRNAA